MSAKKLSEALFSVLPTGLSSELKSDIDELVQTQFEQMNLVSRSEFDVQQKVLAKARLKLERLEELVKELQQNIG
ncbi:MAG: BMFP domain-containing protein YqiC [Saprospiraceae bacterium]|jgi:BMFP domain-containing protein YqiC